MEVYRAMTIHPHSALRHAAVLLLVAACLLPMSAASAAPVPEKEPIVLEDPGTTDLSRAEWATFSKQLVRALTSDHEGLQLSAMQLVIKYGERVDVKRARYDVMRLYRDHENERVRRMAVVTLGEMNSPWAMQFLSRSRNFEKSDDVRQTITAVLAAYYTEQYAE